VSATGRAATLAEALSDGASLEHVLDLVDDAIEGAAADGDSAALAALAEELAVLAERGGEWRRLTIAAARARALARQRGGSPEAGPRPPAPSEQPTPPPHRETPHVVYAGWWRRATAFVIDWIIIGIALGMVASVSVPGLLQALLPLAYFAGFHAFSDGATLGKAMLGIAVRIADGRPVGFGRTLARVVATGVLWATILGGLVDVILAATGDRRQSLHDMIVGTVVVRTRTSSGIA